MLSLYSKALFKCLKPTIFVSLCNSRSCFPSQPNCFFSDNAENLEEIDDSHRTHWKEEIELPKYATTFIRKQCKKVPLAERQTAWKEYLALMRSRDSEKNFFDWGTGSITTDDRMKPIVYDEITSLAHAEFRFAKDYTVVSRILRDIQPVKNFSPSRFLDIGCGTGSSTLAFLESYPSIKECTLVDGSEYMLDFTEGLLSAKNAALSIASYSSLLSLLEKKEKSVDMISLHRFLSDLPSNKARASAVVIAWELLQPGGVIVVAEEGTRWGFHLTRCARSLLLKLDGSVIAPCFHEKECPLKGNKNCWCHFAQQCAPGPTAPYQSRRKKAEVYSYCVIRKTPHEETGEKSRVLTTPAKRDQHVLIDLCCPDGSCEKRVYSKGKMKDNLKEYRKVRKAEWGGILSY